MEASTTLQNHAAQYPINQRVAIIYTPQLLRNCTKAAISDLRYVVTALSADNVCAPIAPSDYSYTRLKTALQSSIFHLTEVRNNTRKSSGEWKLVNSVIKTIRQASQYEIRLSETVAALTALCDFERALAPCVAARPSADQDTAEPIAESSSG